MDNDALLYALWGLIPTALLIYKMIKAGQKEAKESTSVDAQQNERLVKVESEIKEIRNTLSEIKGRLNSQDSRVAKEIEKLERKIDKLTDIVLEIAKN